MAEEKGNIISSGLNLMNTAYNGAGGIVISGDAVKGGYFVTDTIDNIPSWSNVEGTLCYCTGDLKFYQYNDSSKTWQETGIGANTWRKIQLDGTDKLGTGINTNPLNIKAGSNMTITESNGTFTFAATDTDTKNTAGATNSTNQLYLVGAGSQGTNPQTFSNSSVYMTNGTLTTSSIMTSSIKSSSNRLSLEVTSSDGITYNVADFVADSTKGTNATLSGYLTVSGDDDGSSTDKPTDQTGSSDLDTHYFNTGIALYDNDNGITHKLSFPAKSGIFATLDDTKIEIVDLTGN